ncbi:MAG: universal stress protein, partial [Rudaea sp.]
TEYAGGTGLPPIDVYQVGDVYFVLDGNHRVSVARQQGITFIEANVIQVQSPVPLTPDIRPDDLIVKAEYANFLAETCLHERRPDVDLSLTVPGQYDKLRAQVQVQQELMEQQQGRTVPLPDAALVWYDESYCPMVSAIRERGLLRWFPGRTEADLYLWVWEHRSSLEKELGWAIRPDAAVIDLAARARPGVESSEGVPGSWRKARMLDRYSDRLFMDILVPLDGTEESWLALKQAILIARREATSLHGLHVVQTETRKNSPTALLVQTRFAAECTAAGIEGTLAIEPGNVVKKICERALLTDLVVLKAANPPKAGLPGLSSRLRSIIWRLARPLLAVPCETSEFRRALLAYDGSPKAKEALFVAAYLAEMWKTQLTVVAVEDKNRVASNVLDYAREYLEMHEVQAEFIMENRGIGILLEIARQRQLDSLLLGGYSISALRELLGGSAVNFLLREACRPLLLCR